MKDLASRHFAVHAQVADSQVLEKETEGVWVGHKVLRADAQRTACQRGVDKVARGRRANRGLGSDVRRPRLHVLNDEDVAQRLEIRIECLAIEGALIKLANVVHDRLDRRLCGNVTCIASQYHAEQEWILASELLVLVIFEDEEPIVVVLRHIEGDLFVSENGYGPATATDGETRSRRASARVR